jgi:hypothetical protein
MTRTIYRDTKTGRFASKKTWKRSKAKGGTRYKRGKIRKKEPGVVIPPGEPEVHEWVISFSYNKSGRSFDVIVTAKTEEEAMFVAKEFLKDDKKAKNITRAKFTGWSFSAAKGNISRKDTGEAEYREDSEAEGPG